MFLPIKEVNPDMPLQLPLTTEEKHLQVCEKNETFWKALTPTIQRLELSLEDAEFCLRCLLGDAPWQALVKSYPDYRTKSVLERKAVAEELLDNPKLKELAQEAQSLSANTFNLDGRSFEWTFQDSENALRLLIDCAQENLERTEGFLTANVITATLGAVKELNKMHEYNVGGAFAEQAKAVIFMNMDELED